MNENETNETFEEMQERERAEGSKVAARETRRFYDDLMAAGFTNVEALKIIVAWTSRPLPTSVAASGDMLERFARSLKE